MSPLPVVNDIACRRGLSGWFEALVRRSAAGLFVLLVATMVFGLGTVLYVGLDPDQQVRVNTEPLAMLALAAFVLLLHASWIVGSGRKKIVLYLRRFRRAAANEALSGAMHRTLKPWARLVVLDDAHLQPVSVPLRERLLTLGKRVSQLLKQPDVDGVVITHGTDTIEETAYFLNLTLKSDKPVVVVGSMRPGTALGADGALNLYDAVLVASNPASRGNGTLVVLNDEIHTGRDVSKTNTFKTETFRSPFGPLGYVVEGRTLFYRLPARPHTLQTQWDIDTITALPEVAVVYAYGNVNPAAVDAAVRSGAKAIVYAATGNGSVGEYMVEPLKAARARGVHVVRASRTGSGVVIRNGEQPDDKYDWIVTDDQLPQKARILMALALTQTNDSKALQQIFWKY